MSSPVLPSQTVNVAPITSLLSLVVSPDSRLNQLPKDIIKFVLMPMMVTKSRQDYKLLRDLSSEHRKKYLIDVMLLKKYFNKELLYENHNNLDVNNHIPHPHYKELYFRNVLLELDKLVGQAVSLEPYEKIKKQKQEQKEKYRLEEFMCRLNGHNRDSYLKN